MAKFQNWVQDTKQKAGGTSGQADLEGKSTPGFVHAHKNDTRALGDKAGKQLSLKALRKAAIHGQPIQGKSTVSQDPPVRMA